MWVCVAGRMMRLDMLKCLMSRDIYNEHWRPTQAVIKSCMCCHLNVENNKSWIPQVVPTQWPFLLDLTNYFGKHTYQYLLLVVFTTNYTSTLGS